MNKRPSTTVRLLAILSIGAAAAITHARSGGGNLPESSTRAFFIDGRSFEVGTPGTGDLSLLERELKSAGLETVPPDAIPLLLSRSIPDPLREHPPATAGIYTALPAGFEAEHAMRMETESGPVEIAFGGVKAGVGRAFRGLCSDGWDCGAPDPDEARPLLATKTKGGETSIVLLVEKEARFLFLRRPEE